MSFKFYARIKDSVLKQGYGLDEPSFEATKAVYPDEIFVETDAFCSPDTHYFKNGVIVKKPLKPSETSYWDETTTSWIESLQLKKIEIKARRNTLLNASDWTQLADIPQETKDRWEPYRQALRDITTQPGYPTTVTWPTPPQ
jgi:hypothetical protein